MNSHALSCAFIYIGGYVKMLQIIELILIVIN